MATAPFPAPNGFKWVFTPRFWHARAKKYLYAKDYGRKAWCFLARLRKGGSQSLVNNLAGAPC